MIRRIYTHLEEILASVLMSALCVVVALQVFFNLVLNNPISSWTEEVSTILFVWITMIGSSLALKRGEHFAVELLQRNVSPRLTYISGIVVAILLIIFSGLLAWYGGSYALENRDKLTPALEMTYAIPYGALFVGGVMMLIRSVEIFITSIKGREVAA